MEKSMFYSKISHPIYVNYVDYVRLESIKGYQILPINLATCINCHPNLSISSNWILKLIDAVIFTIYSISTNSLISFSIKIL